MGDDMPATRVDFKHVRGNADFAAVLNAYGIELSKDGTKEGQHKALCPFHDDTKPSLKINTSKNIFNCFPCETGGNILEFVMKMDDIDLRPAAIRVAEICGIAPAPGDTARRIKTAKPAQKPSETATEKPREAEGGGAANPPLTFKLKLTKPPALLEWLKSRGIDEETVDRWALGQASAKSKTIANRLAIPIHDEKGQLVRHPRRSRLRRAPSMWFDMSRTLSRSSSADQTSPSSMLSIARTTSAIDAFLAVANSGQATAPGFDQSLLGR